MNSSIINISEVLNNAESLVSAGFSAGYNFNEASAAEYFDELVENSKIQMPIFSGIIIVSKSKNNYTIIDGLQRLTTICLLLCALCEKYKNTSKNNENVRNEIFSMFLLNNNGVKLQLENKEQEILEKILFSKELSDEELQSNLFQTYRSFLAKMSGRKISGTQLFRIISKIQFMVVVVDKSEISPREIYQALNINKDKFQINLISDFIAKTDSVASLIWQKIINSYRDSADLNLLMFFIQDFLTIQNNGQIPSKNALYQSFKAYFSKIAKFQAPTTIIENFYKYSQYYLKIVNANFDNLEIKEQITILNNSEGKDAYPYLMEVLEDLENEHINTNMFLDILKMINSFVIKRFEDPSSDINFNFTTLSKELNKMLVSPDYTQNVFDETKLTINEMNNLSDFEV